MNDTPHAEAAILNAALELRPDQRASYLERACGNDIALRRQVEALLQAHEQAGKFLAEPPAALPFNRTDLLKVPLTEKPGDTIGRYKLLQQIGEGGCGVVYMAEQDEPLKRRVALKIIKLGMDTRQVIARFEAERQALALMDHPNIAKVFDAGATETGRPYFVMELVRGVRITNFCDENKVSTEERLRLFIQVCQAIQHAHQKGIIHRDIKPSNILVTVNEPGSPGIPKVIDFGIAKATQGKLTDHTLFTAFEQFMGTPAYMSPEQAVMTAIDVDTRSDIYSLGVLLYELLTGCTPFDQKELLAAGLEEMRRTIREREPIKPSTRLSTMLEGELTVTAQHRQTAPPKLVHRVRGDLDWIVMKCLEKERARRYETANGLAADIQRHLNCEPVVARPPGGFYSFKKMVRRHRTAFAAGGLGAGLLLLTVALLSIANIHIRRERNEKTAALRGKEEALTAAQKSEEQARDRLFTALQSQAQARRHSREQGQRIGSLEAVRQAAAIRPTAGLRDEAIAAMALPDVRPGPTWRTWQPSLRPTAFDERFHLYAQADTNGLISIRTIPENREVRAIQSSPAIRFWTAGRSLLLSPDGQYLAELEDNYQLQVWRVEDAKPALCCEPEGCWALAFSPNSRELAVGQGNWVLRFDLASGRELNRWQVPQQPYSLEFAPDNRRLAIGYTNAEIVSVYDVETGASMADLPVGSSEREVVAWHPDGKHLAVGGSDPRIQIWDLTSRRRITSLEGHIQQVVRLSFHPQGELLTSLSWEPFFRMWHPSPGRQLMRIPLQPAGGFSSDGRWAGVFWQAENEAQLLGIIPSEEYHTFVSGFGDGESGFYQGDISPDGALLALGANDGVRVWDLFTGQELAWLPCGLTGSVFFGNKGQELITCGPQAGVQRWKLQRSDKRVLAEPAQVIRVSFTPGLAARGNAENAIACTDELAGRAFVFDLQESNKPPVTITHSNVTCIALSPDGQWLATSGWHSDKTCLWNAQTGDLVHEFTDTVCSRTTFSSDSKELVVSRRGEFLIYDVAPLRLKRNIPRQAGLYPGWVAYSADGHVMALELAAGIIELQETSSGRTVARLEDPYGDLSTWLAFTPDGTQLVVVSTYAGAIHRWDLRAIRNHLKALGLDLDSAEFAHPKVASEPAPAIPPSMTRTPGSN